MDTILSRTFDAPVDVVWKAWTRPEYIRRWWGPKDYTAPFAEIDLREGGKYLYDMRSPEGQDFWSTGTILEIVPREKIVITDSFSDEKGNIVPASHYGMQGGWPLETLATVTFEDHDSKTTLTLLSKGTPPGEMAEMAKAGWNESFDKLERVLMEERPHSGKNAIVAVPGTQVATLTRIIDAPPDRLFRAFTDPKLIPLWWGPSWLTTTVDTIDPKSGGSWRFVQHDAEGNEYAFHGVYHEVSPGRIAQTSEWEGMPGHVQLEIAVLEDLHGKTRLMEKSLAESVEDARGMLESGMIEGWKETVDRLADLVETKWDEVTSSMSQWKTGKKRPTGAKDMHHRNKKKRIAA